MSDMPERRAVTKKKVETAIKKWCHPEGDITWTEKSITCVDEDGKEITIKFKPDTSRAVTFRLLFDYIKGLDAAEYLDAEVDYGEDEPEGEEEEEAGEGDEDDKGGGAPPSPRPRGGTTGRTSQRSGRRRKGAKATRTTGAAA